MHVMLDLETMGTRPDAAIVAIGAVKFDVVNNTVVDTFYRTVSLSSSMCCGGTVDASTVMWWLEQSEAARAALKRDPVDIAIALYSFSTWMSSIRTLEGMWGNGSDFDNVILRSAYEAQRAKLPWKYSLNRCYRTLKALAEGRGIEAPLRQGTHHNALDDATHQAKCALVYLRGLQAST